MPPIRRLRHHVALSADTLRLDQLVGCAGVITQLSGTPLPPEDRKESLAAYKVLRRVGFVTAVGCTCLLPATHEDGSPGVLVCPARLEIAALSLGSPLRRAELRAFSRTGRPSSAAEGGLGLVFIRARVVAEQWATLGREDEAGSDAQAERADFLSRFAKFSQKLPPAALQLSSSSCTCDLNRWFGLAFPLEALDEQALRSLSLALEVEHRPGEHYGMGWRPLGHARQPERLVLYDALRHCAPASLSFLLGVDVPGAPYDAGANEPLLDVLERLLSRRAGAARAGEMRAQDALRMFLPRDGRMVLMSEQREATQRSQREGNEVVVATSS